MTEGDYVRTKDGIIDQVIIEYNGYCASPSCNCKHVSCRRNYYDEDKIIKSSPTIIDLIEVGDYVNGLYVHGITDYGLEVYMFGDAKEYLKEDEIQTIVTKEQFSCMKYKIGE